MYSTAGLITQGEAAERLRVSRTTIRRWAREGQLSPPVRIGRYAYYRPETIRDFIDDKLN